MTRGFQSIRFTEGAREWGENPGVIMHRRFDTFVMRTYRLTWATKHQGWVALGIEIWVDFHSECPARLPFMQVMCVDERGTLSRGPSIRSSHLVKFRSEKESLTISST